MGEGEGNLCCTAKHLGRAELRHADLQGVGGLLGGQLGRGHAGHIDVPLQPMLLLPQHVGAALAQATEVLLQQACFLGKALVQLGLQYNSHNTHTGATRLQFVPELCSVQFPERVVETSGPI